MDEPTASLSAHEVDRLFDQVSRLRDRGVAVLFISHRLDEVFRIADRITVFRDGRHISTRLVAETNHELLVREMVGRDIGDFFVRTRHVPGKPVLRVEGSRPRRHVRRCELEVCAGEVVGFAGLVGAGRTDVGLALFGIAPAEAAASWSTASRSPSAAPRRHATRHRLPVRGPATPRPVDAPVGGVEHHTSGDPQLSDPFGLLDRPAEEAVAGRFRDSLQIRTASLRTPVGNLSGGNQQKTMLARWLNVAPRILVLDEPTRGIDVGAKADVHQLIDDLARDGVAVIVISSDLPEVLAMSDRIVVMREGRVRGVFTHDEADPERVMAAAVAA